MKAILCAVDGSESASPALERAIELCRETGAVLNAIAVKPPILTGRGRAIAVRSIDEERGAAAIADAAVTKARDAGVQAHAVLDGHAAEEIADAAKRIDADLVVIGSRGLGAISGVLMGSVSRALVRRCPVPVTIVAHQEVREPQPA